jgi:hypothetical protein
VALKFDGGGADDPLPKHPLSKGVTIATINMQTNFFTVEFLEGVFVAVFAVPILRCNRFPETHCGIEIAAGNPGI